MRGCPQLPTLRAKHAVIVTVKPQEGREHGLLLAISLGLDNLKTRGYTTRGNFPMEEKTLSIKLEFRRSQLLYVLTFFLIALNTKNLSPESVTLSTYYPAPAGVYNNMVTIGNTWLARDPVPATGQPSFLELGSNAAVSPGTKFSVMNGNVGIGTTDPSLGGQVSSIFTINAPATTGLAIANNGTPSFALNPQSDGSWQMFDHASGSWMQ